MRIHVGFRSESCSAKLDVPAVLNLRRRNSDLRFGLNKRCGERKDEQKTIQYLHLLKQRGRGRLARDHILETRSSCTLATESAASGCEYPSLRRSRCRSLVPPAARRVRQGRSD